MTERPQNPAEAGLRAWGDVVGGVVAAQQRSVGLAQDWSESVIETYKSQAESYRALTDATRSSLAALEKTLKSQEETNRALRESLEAYRRVVESASETQERNAELAQSYFDNVVRTLQGQLESSRALLLEPDAKQQEFFQNVTQEWLDAYTKLLKAPLDLYRASAQRAAGETRGENP
jgi:DNA anti-recombination protein RmuC